MQQFISGLQAKFMQLKLFKAADKCTEQYTYAEIQIM